MPVPSLTLVLGWDTEEDGSASAPALSARSLGEETAMDRKGLASRQAFRTGGTEGGETASVLGKRSEKTSWNKRQ